MGHLNIAQHLKIHKYANFKSNPSQRDLLYIKADVLFRQIEQRDILRFYPLFSPLIFLFSFARAVRSNPFFSSCGRKRDFSPRTSLHTSSATSFSYSHFYSHTIQSWPHWRWPLTLTLLNGSSFERFTEPQGAPRPQDHSQGHQGSQYPPLRQRRGQAGRSGHGHVRALSNESNLETFLVSISGL